MRPMFVLFHLYKRSKVFITSQLVLSLPECEILVQHNDLKHLEPRVIERLWSIRKLCVPSIGGDCSFIHSSLSSTHRQV